MILKNIVHVIFRKKKDICYVAIKYGLNMEFENFFQLKKFQNKIFLEVPSLCLVSTRKALFTLNLYTYNWVHAL